MNFILIVASILEHKEFTRNIRENRPPPFFFGAHCFFSAAPCEPGDALTLDCIFQRTDLNSDGETNAALHMEKHCVNDVSKPVMNFQGLAKEDLGDISRRYSLETDHQNWIKHLLQNKSLRFDGCFWRRKIQISIQMIHTFSWLRKLWFS